MTQKANTKANKQPCKKSKTAVSQKKHAPEKLALPSGLTHEKRSVLVSQLTLSALNARQSVTNEEIVEMAESIKTVGLLQNLAGLEVKKGKTTKIEIVFGGRRMRALQLIADEDKETDMTVDVIMAKNAVEAAAWAGAENSARSQPHPADEITAYKKSIDLGATEDQVAKAFGVTVRHVKGRLKLANIATVILDALRTNEITLDVAAAYTLSNDLAKQAECFEKYQQSWIGNDPREIKARLNEDAIDGDTALAQFVTLEAYEDAGGKINEDLFGDDLFFLDPDLLHKLADEKCEIIKAEFEGNGWKWVEFLPESPSWEAMRSYGQTYPQTADVSEEDQANLDELEALVKSGKGQQADIDALDELENRLRQRVFSKTQKDHSGLMFWIGYNGEISTNQGYVHPDHIADAIAAKVLEAERPSGSAPTKKKGPYPEALQRDMATIRTMALQTALFREPEFALDLLIFGLSTSIYSEQNPIGISTTNKKIEVEGDDGQQIPEVLDRVDYCHPMNAKTAAEGFAQFRELKPEQKTGIMVEHLARTLEAGLSLPTTLNPLVEMLATFTNANPREIWTPTTSFLKRLTSPQLDEIMHFIAGNPPAKSFTGMKKMDKVARLHALFNNDVDRKGMSKEAIERIATWVPQGFENIDLAVGELPKDEPKLADDGDDEVGAVTMAIVADHAAQENCDVVAA